MFTIDKDFEGGNIAVFAVGEDFANVGVELRDTGTDWFYWAFHVTGAEGKTIHFRFQDNAPRLGYFGPAVSLNLLDWNWKGTPDEDYQGFTYSFAADETSVYFCHDMRYSTAQFEQLCQELALEKKTLAISEKGHPVPYIEFGSGDKVLLLTSRHHCCESTGTYLWEGAIRNLIANPIPGFTVIAIPFVDYDGVVNGDQGKNRKPHDHNRDYIEGIYASVRAIMELSRSRNIVFAQDLHSPWHFGGSNDVGYGVYNEGTTELTKTFCKLLTEACRKNPAAFQYDTANDMHWGVEWNTTANCGPNQMGFTGYFVKNPGTKHTLSLETPYYGTKDNQITQKRMLALGSCVAEALRSLAQVAQ